MRSANPAGPPNSRTHTATRQVSRRWLLRAAAGTGAGAALGLSFAVGKPTTVIASPRGSTTGAPTACNVPPREPVPFAAPDPRVRWTSPPAPTITAIQHVAGQYAYTVNGQPETILGMGYNPPVERMTPTARRQRLEQDLPLMAGAGVNTLIGWNPAAIDGLALDVAQQAGLGVALPFDIDFTTDLRDSGARRAFTDAVLAWVEQYRAHPAVRMWAIGNEVLQRSVPPAWCSSGPTADQNAWADAWTTLFVETADEVRSRDPLHPVLYREAEDSYAPWLARALAARPAYRPWLVYGINAYTPRLAEIIESWPQRAIPTSVLISEYAPLNAPHGERTAGFRAQWAAVRAHPEYVLGGAVYVWSTDGPEEVDRQFGLVDAGGQPVDDALDAISALYHAEATTTPGTITSRTITSRTITSRTGAGDGRRAAE